MIKFIKYFFVGGIAALVDLSLFMGLVKLVHLPWYFAALISFSIATLVNYILSINHVFKSGVRFDKKQEIFLVFFVSLIGLGINQVVLGLCISLLKIHIFFAKIIATGVVFLWNYAARHKFVFKEKTLCAKT